MLQAFKTDRQHASSGYNQPKFGVQEPVNKEQDNNLIDDIRNKLSRGLDNNGPLGEANAILDAIDSMIKLRSL
jgi:hypothetical protein